MCSPCQTRKLNSSGTNFPLGVKIIYLRAWSAHISDGKRKRILFQIKANEQTVFSRGIFKVNERSYFTKSTSRKQNDNCPVNHHVTKTHIWRLKKYNECCFSDVNGFTPSEGWRYGCCLSAMTGNTTLGLGSWTNGCCSSEVNGFAKKAGIGLMCFRSCSDKAKLQSGICVWHLPASHLWGGKKLGPICMYLASWVDTGWDRHGKGKVQLFGR